MQIELLLERYDLTFVHAFLALFGAIISVYVMQLTHYEAEDDVDPPLMRHLRRLGLAILAWGFLWTLTYSEARNWQPWPPALLLMFAIDAILLIRALAIKARVKRTGVKPDAPRASAPDMRLNGN